MTRRREKTRRGEKTRRVRRPGGRPAVTLLLGLGLLGLFAGALAVATTADQGWPLATRTTVTAAFTEVGSLRSGDDVRIAGVRVGAVRGVSLRDGRATAVLELDGVRPVYRDASVTTASVGARSALGQKFVDLDPGRPESGPLGPGDVVPPRETRGAQELGDLIAVFDPPTRAAMAGTLRQAGGGMIGHRDDLAALLRSGPAAVPALGTVARSFVGPDGGRDLAELLASTNRLAQRFAGRDRQIADLTGELDATLAAVSADGGGPLRDTLTAAPDSLRETRAALDALAPPLADTERAMTDLAPGASNLGRSGPDLRGVFREAPGPLDALPPVSEAAAPAFRDLTGPAGDLRPLSGQLRRLLGDTDPLAGHLAPYAPEISRFFTGMTGALSDHDASGHWLRVAPMFEGQSALGSVPVPDPTVARNAYPRPGRAEHDARPAPLPGGR
jgi:phospholipid/cholesterol/gamma-HCH transport system substrate-binding protein